MTPAIDLHEKRLARIKKVWNFCKDMSRHTLIQPEKLRPILGDSDTDTIYTLIKTGLGSPSLDEKTGEVVGYYFGS